MANEKNLIPLNQRSKSVQREIQEKGRQANKEKWAEKKRFRELFTELLDDTTTEHNGKTLVTREAIATKAVEFLTDPNKEISAKDFIKVVEFIRDTVGEKPVEKQEITVPEHSEKLNEIFAQLGNGGLTE